MNEHELKYMLTQEQYNAIIGVFRKRWDKKQHTNYYYDTLERELDKIGVTLRIREHDNSKKELQLKIPVFKSQNLRVKSEKNIPFEGEIPSDIKVKDIISFPFPINCSKLNLLGSLLTIRHEAKCKGATITLDNNRYLGISDYELEIEFKSEDALLAKEIEKIIINKFTISPDFMEGKRSRFLRQLDNLNVSKE